MAFDPKNYASADALKKSIDMTKEALADKVDKVEGKQLSTEDYTSAEKSKLAGIAEGANYYTLPIADANTLGGVKIGTGITVAADGTISASGGGSLSPATTSTLGGVLASDAITVASNGMMDIGQSIAGDGLEVVAGSVVPSGYTPVEYLHGTGQCIQNLYAMTATSIRIETEFASDVPSTGEWDIIGGGGDPNWANIPIIILQTAATINGAAGHNTDVTVTDYQIGAWMYNTYAISGVVPSINIFHKVVADWGVTSGQMSITVDDVTHSYTCTNGRATSLCLFGNGQGGNNPANIKMKYMRIYQGSMDTPVMNLIPAKNSSNVYGMYDTVSKTFFTKTGGAGDFSGGDPITITATSYMNITPATTNDIGGVKVGTGLSIDGSGVLSVTGGSAEIPVATELVLGGVKQGTSVSIANDGKLELSSNLAGNCISISTESVSIPDAYQPCEYISGGTSLDTGIANQMIVTIDASFAQTGAQLIGFELAANRYFGVDSQNRITAEWTLDDYVEGANSANRNIIHCRFENGQRSLVSVDGVLDTSIGYNGGIVSNYAALSGFNLFGIAGYTSNMKLYGASMTSLDGETYYRNYIPCYVKANPSSVGLYDTVSETFYQVTSATKGPDIVLPGGQLKINVTVDSELDITSENPVQNKVIASVLGDINTVLEGVL